MIKQDTWQDVPVYTLENESLAVTLCPSIGNNVYRIWDKEAEREVLRVPDSPDVLRKSPVHYGTPVLIPPNRIRSGYFMVGEREYQFDRNEKNNTGNHIHGLVVGRPWTVIDHGETEGTQYITSVFKTTDHPDVFKQLPHEMIIEMTYVLQGSRLLQKVTVTNESKAPAPFGYGVHTWFRLDGEPGKWTLKLPVDDIWELGEDLMPTGRLLPLGDLAGLKEGLPLEGVNLDNVFQNGANPALAVLAKDGYEIVYKGSDLYKQWVIYTMGTASEFICLEPYTWVTNAPNVELPSEVTGFRTIAPGQSLSFDLELDIRRS
ncbi:aldose 1-epimerase [Paenibacillus sp. J31TS4]|uniref:aldose 1-epimerase n=1 Tax=Paenibacillus sp. J31TS4 TaxID=2807195 RepID=UPI001BD09387|nr:aldose 1-epimerase [Paenibacillus sp. J31TS4]